MCKASFVHAQELGCTCETILSNSLLATAVTAAAAAAAIPWSQKNWEPLFYKTCRLVEENMT